MSVSIPVSDTTILYCLLVCRYLQISQMWHELNFSWLKANADYELASSAVITMIIIYLLILYAVSPIEKSAIISKLHSY